MTGTRTIDASAPATQLPFAGYDRMGDTELVQALRHHTQSELEAVESYERAHKGREAVLNKLRYLRQSQPLPGYDALSDQEILAAVETADMATLKKVRGYERKFRDRPRVLEATVREQHARRAAEPPKPPPSYAPMSSTDG